MEKKHKSKFLNKAVDIRDRLVEHISQVTKDPESLDDLRQLKELITIIRELDKMVRENVDHSQDDKSRQIDFLESLLQESVNREE